MTFIDSPPINIRKYVYLISPGNPAEFLHTFLSLEGAREYCQSHWHMRGNKIEGVVYEVREVERVIDKIDFNNVGEE